MKTRSPISTISYNTPSFLCTKLEELRTAHIITEWYAVPHAPEDDEKKHHIHVFLVPAKTISTDGLAEEFIEVDIHKPLGKPLKCLPFKSSKFPDWYLYCLHDVSYLSSKGQRRKYHYTPEDFLVCDLDYFREQKRSISQTKYSVMERLMGLAQQHTDFYEVMRMGLIPPEKFISYSKYYWALVDCYAVDRNGRSNHEDEDTYTNPDTGEVFEKVDMDEFPQPKVEFERTDPFKSDIYEHYSLRERCSRWLVETLEKDEENE